MKKLINLTKPFMWSILMTSLVCIFMISLINRVYDPAETVSKGFENPITITNETMLFVIPQHISTQYLNKIELQQSKAVLELKFTNMTDLVDNLSISLDQLTTLFFVVSHNIDEVLIYVSEASLTHYLYEIRLNRMDYEAGKEIQIKPLS